MNNNLSQTLYESVKKGKFTPRFYDILNCFSQSPKILYDNFLNFILFLLNLKDPSKTSIIENGFNAVINSSNLLNAFFEALYLYNNQKFREINEFHSFLNENLCRKNWSRIGIPNILKINQPIPQKDVSKELLHPIDTCIYEIVFRNMPIDVIVQSPFVSVPVDATFDLLSQKSQERFADALLIRYQNQPQEILSRILNKKDFGENLYLIESIFRLRSDYSIILNAFNFDFSSFPKYREAIEKIFHKINHNFKKDIFPFFVYLILPYASEFSNDFITEVIESPIFPSDKPDFPKQMFLSSDICTSNMTFKVLFDIYNEGDPAEFIQLFQNINANKPIDDESIFDLFFSSFEKAKDKAFLTQIFNEFLKFRLSSLTPENIYKIISIFIIQYITSVCSLCTSTINNNISPQLFLHIKTLNTFFDAAFIQPEPALNFISTIAAKFPDDSNIILFWVQNLFCFIETIINNHMLSEQFSQCLSNYFTNAPTQVIDQIANATSYDHNNFKDKDNPALCLLGQLMNR